jgi:hypothetical protein
LGPELLPKMALESLNFARNFILFLSALSNYERSLEIDSKFIDAGIAVKELRMKVKGVEVQ